MEVLPWPWADCNEERGDSLGVWRAIAVIRARRNRRKQEGGCAKKDGETARVGRVVCAKGRAAARSSLGADDGAGGRAVHCLMGGDVRSGDGCSGRGLSGGYGMPTNPQKLRRSQFGLDQWVTTPEIIETKRTLSVEIRSRTAGCGAL